MLPPPWRDPKTDPPEEYTEVIVWLETDRITSSKYYKGKFSTYVPVIGWQPFPELPKTKSAVRKKVKKE